MKVVVVLAAFAIALSSYGGVKKSATRPAATPQCSEDLADAAAIHMLCFKTSVCGLGYESTLAQIAADRKQIAHVRACVKELEKCSRDAYGRRLDMYSRRLNSREEELRDTKNAAIEAAKKLALDRYMRQTKFPSPECDMKP